MAGRAGCRPTFERRVIRCHFWGNSGYMYAIIGRLYKSTHGA